MNTPTEKKTLGEIAFEAFDGAQDLGDPGHWYQQPTDVKLWWESSANAVKEAMLAELPGEWVFVSPNETSDGDEVWDCKLLRWCPVELYSLADAKSDHPVRRRIRPSSSPEPEIEPVKQVFHKEHYDTSCPSCEGVVGIGIGHVCSEKNPLPSPTTEEDILARLDLHRVSVNDPNDVVRYMHETAARITALTRERDEARRINVETLRDSQEQHNRAEQAEKKLAEMEEDVANVIHSELNSTESAEADLRAAGQRILELESKLTTTRAALLQRDREVERLTRALESSHMGRAVVHWMRAYDSVKCSDENDENCQILRVPKNLIPKGAKLVEAYETERQFIILGVPESDDEAHNCDAMGCSTLTHVVARMDKALSQPAVPAGGLHPDTAALIHEFAAALYAKLLKSQEKYGYGASWQNLGASWTVEDCQKELMRHIGKGDPLDVAAYCAFLWKKGFPTAAPAGETGGWRDIATAPKDGTHILLFAPEQEFAGEVTPIRVTAGNWIEMLGDHGGDMEDYSGWGSWDGGFTEENPPTHWMPLPPAPAPTETDGAPYCQYCGAKEKQFCKCGPIAKNH